MVNSKKNTDSPIVSVLCQVYNHESYIKQCLEGIIMQKTQFKFEVLIHDDASTDNSAAIIKEYELKYPDLIKPLYQTQNQYSQNKRVFSNIQLPRVSGKYIAICEGDDYWTDEYKLQKQVDFLDNHDDYGLVHTDLDYYFTEKDKFEKAIWAKARVNTIPLKEDIYNDMMYTGNTSIYFCTICFRAKLINEDYYNVVKQHFKMGDAPLCLHIARISKIGYINERTAVKNVLSSSATMGQSFENKLAFTRSIWDIYEYFNKIKPFILDKNQAYQYQLIMEMDDCFKYSNKKEFDFRFNQLNREFKSTEIRLKKLGLSNKYLKLLIRIIIKMRNILK